METRDLITPEQAALAVAGVKPPPTFAARAGRADALVAPAGTPSALRPWEGPARRKAQHYRVTAMVPHLETPECLPACLELLRLQTARPYCLVIDTGSTFKTCCRLERLRCPDVEVHYLRAHSWQHSSEPVTAALDTALALCRTEWMFLTHSDVFLRRRDFLGELLELCTPACPVVGYEMSPREGTDAWRGVVSHTATMVHVPTLRRVGATWNLARFFDRAGWWQAERAGWPDTESGFDLCLRQHGIKPLLIGKDRNLVRHTDANLDHARSYTGLKLYGRGGEVERRSRENLRQALREAYERVAAWRQEADRGR